MLSDDKLLLTTDELKALHEKLEPGGTLHEDTQLERRYFRNLFISDTHIGRHDCKSVKLTIFLDLAKVSEVAYFNGDIVDWWLFRASRPHHFGRIFKDDTRLRTSIRLLQYGAHFALRIAKIDVFKPREAAMMRWPQAHNDPLQKMFRIIRKARAILIGGNHDELIRGFTNDLHLMGAEAALSIESARMPQKLRDMYFQSPALGNLDLVEEIVHVAKNGEHLHVCHGDRFDPPFKKSSRAGMMATRVFHNGVVPVIRASGFKETAARITNIVNGIDGKDDMTPFYNRYADFLDAENEKISRYNEANPQNAPRPLLRGGIHGHIHNPGIRYHRGYVFMDSGDFVDDAHCTGLVEHEDGSWQIMTVDEKRGIYPHPVTPDPITIFDTSQKPENARRREIKTATPC